MTLRRALILMSVGAMALPFCCALAAGAPNLAITVAGATGTSFSAGESWTLDLTSGLPDASFSICAIDNNGGSSCTPWGTTDANGNWTGTGSFSTSTVGSWTEWVSFPTQGATSNQITFTVAAASACPAALQQAIQDAGAVDTEANEALSSQTNASVIASLSSAIQSLGQAISSLVAEAGCTASETAAPVSTPTPTPTPTPNSAPTAAAFPVTILVTVPSLNVRSAPNTSAALAGSQVLYSGNEFTATNEVVGDSVNGNDLWWVSSQGNYVWSGGTEVAGSATVSAPSGAAPTLLGAGGYNSGTGKYEASENTFETGDNYLILYGTFDSSGNVVNINRQALSASDITYQGATQINVALAGGFAGKSFMVSVTNANGTTAPVTINGSATATGLSPSLTLKAALNEIMSATSLQQVLDIASAAKFPVNVSQGDPDQISVEIDDPTTGKIMIVASQDDAPATTVNTLPTTSGTSGTSNSNGNSPAICSVGSSQDNVLVSSDGNVYGINGNYNINVNCVGGSGSTCGMVSEGMQDAVGNYNAVSGMPQGTIGGTAGNQAINIVFYPSPSEMSSDVAASAAGGTAVSFTMGVSGDYSSVTNTSAVCNIAVNGENITSVADAQNWSQQQMQNYIAGMVEHEMGHCFGLEHNDGGAINSVMFGKYLDTAWASTGAMPIVNDPTGLLSVLQQLATGKVSVSSCVKYTGTPCANGLFNLSDYSCSPTTYSCSCDAGQPACVDNNGNPVAISTAGLAVADICPSDAAIGGLSCSCDGNGNAQCYNADGSLAEVPSSFTCEQPVQQGVVCSCFNGQIAGCTDSNGNPASPPADFTCGESSASAGGYDCSDNACSYNESGGSYSDYQSCLDACESQSQQTYTCEGSSGSCVADGSDGPFTSPDCDNECMSQGSSGGGGGPGLCDPYSEDGPSCEE